MEPGREGEGPLEDRSLEREVSEICAGTAPFPVRLPSLVTAEATLADLGFDSLACADLAATLEERFGVRLADADMTGIRTVADVARVVRRKTRALERIPPGTGRLQPSVKLLGGPVFRWHSRLEVRGEDNVPASGPVVIAANHRSMLDIPLLVVACPRPVTFMAKIELYRFPPFAWLWRELGGFPVRRQIADVRAIDIGLAVLERGGALGLYPEGTRSKTGEMLPFLNGAAWLALKAGAALVPCGIRGTGRPSGTRAGLRKRVRVAFGRAIPLDRIEDNAGRRREAAELTGRVLTEITALLA